VCSTADSHGYEYRARRDWPERMPIEADQGEQPPGDYRDPEPVAHRSRRAAADGPPRLIEALTHGCSRAVTRGPPSCRDPEVSNLRVERALEGRPRRAARDILRETLVAGDNVGVLEDAQHRRHHEIAGRK